MKSTLITLLLSFTALFSFAQEDTVHVDEPLDSIEIEIPEIPCDVYVEPQFPGGERAMVQFLWDSLDCSNCLVEESGLVAYVQFSVEIDGSLSEFECIYGNQCIGDAGIEMLKIMPKWTPGFNCGVATKVRFTIPLRVEMR